MKRLILVLSLLAITDVSFAENQITASTEVVEDVSVKNNWGANSNRQISILVLTSRPNICGEEWR